MKVAILFSGGKDSNYALHLARQYGYTISCLITIQSENSSSYMFQSLGQSLLHLQSEALGIPLLQIRSKGEKETELTDLFTALTSAKEQYGIEGVVSGAIESVYQASRIQRLSHEIGLWCFCPLWQRPRETYLQELISAGFSIIILGIFAYPLTKEDVGKIITSAYANHLASLAGRYGLHQGLEGGEAETFVLDGPDFQQHIALTSYQIQEESENACYMQLEEAILQPK